MTIAASFEETGARLPASGLEVRLVRRPNPAVCTAEEVNAHADNDLTLRRG